MAGNHTPDRVHAQGEFVPVVAAPFTSAVLMEKGIASFQRVAAGQYLVTLQEACAFSEGSPEAYLPANVQAVPGASLSPDGKQVLLTCLALGTGAPVDPPFIGFTLWAIQQGQGQGPAVALPPIPPPLPPPAGDGSAVLIFGANSVFATTADRYLYPSYTDSNAMTSPVQYRAPRAGTLDNLRVRHNTPNGNGNDIEYTVQVNGAASLLTITMPSTDSDGSILATPVAVAAGDLLDLIVKKAAPIGGSPADIAASLEFRS